MNDVINNEEMIQYTTKRWFILKTNGVANIRTINSLLSSAPEVPNFWLPGYMAPRKFRKNTILRKQFLYFDYAFIELQDPYAFEKFLSSKGVSAYFLHMPGTRHPISLTEEEIRRVKDLEAFKQIESDQFKIMANLKVGAYIEVVNGSFIGCKGTVIEVSPTHAVLEMNVFGRPTRVSVGLDFLENLLQTYEEESAVDDEDIGPDYA